ncbi:homoserine kinase [Thermosporothrix hazakensis]|jgi:homoserine kinase|uniref:Homoserine kinase n=1 Tax=Thermosporothrix hazakensis TaxID=644383 RepID=A0A326UED9_THEHA|nr:homoserine kinase [Thermosporothrix hazakensis]PZW36211.1 homoserine kinase [Thermosporothrix hazakensis]GCE46861.1 homoserine kinase [Thermosporothrix hazakensis]
MALVLPASITVLTPATSANLGPGFDSLGLALQLYNRFTVEEVDGDPLRPQIEIQGSLGAQLSTEPDNLFFKAFALLFERQGVPLPAIKIRMEIRIPPGCGLGSSATAAVGGLVAANEWLRRQNRALPQEELLELAVAVEAGNHPDNVAPALLGGLVATTSVGGNIRAIKTPFPGDLKAVIFTPSFSMDTVAGRKLLPSSYPKADVTFNTGRVALLLTALQTGQYDLIGEAMQDRLHQPYRQALFPAMNNIIQAAVEAGAYGACLSGGGSSLIALASSRFQAILRAMEETARAAGIEGTGLILRADQTGARVLQGTRARSRKDVRARYGNQFCWSPARPGSR